MIWASSWPSTARSTGLSEFLPYGRQMIDNDDVAAVVDVLRSDWLTTGPRVEEFEQAFAEHVGVAHAVAVSSGTAALHSAMFAADIGPGDEVIVPAMTFAASANCVVFQGGTPVFADVDEKAVVAVDYAGQPCDYDALTAIAGRHGLTLVADACHAPGATYKGRSVGTLADLSAFSFHPVKHLTTGEGGMVATNDAGLAKRMRAFRNHGIQTDFRERTEKGTWFYEMTELGYNYRITDFQCALGLSQLKKLAGWVERRSEIAKRYDEAFAGERGVEPLARRADRTHAYHLYVVRVGPEATPGRKSSESCASQASVPTSTTSLCICIRSSGNVSGRDRGSVPWPRRLTKRYSRFQCSQRCRTPTPNG